VCAHKPRTHPTSAFLLVLVVVVVVVVVVVRTLSMDCSPYGRPPDMSTVSSSSSSSSS
jgi:hypothetical protein